MNKKFWAGTFTLTGTMIGAGILGLPYVFSKSGFYSGLFWLIFLGLIILYSKLCLGEVILRTKQNHQLIGYADKYLGKWGKRLMFFALVFGIYSALIAYLIGEGESLSYLFFGNFSYAVYFAVGFWILVNFLLRDGLRGIRKIETYGVLTVIFIIILICIYYTPQIDYSNYPHIDFNFPEFLAPFGIVLFSLLGFSALPEVRRELNGSEKLMKKAIIIGTLIPVISYLVFSFVFVGVLGKNILEVATLSLGKISSLLGIFTMFTAFIVLSFALKESFAFDLRYSRTKSFFMYSIIPFVLFLLIYSFNLSGFSGILGIGGVISGGLIGILIFIMNIKAKYPRKGTGKLINGVRKPEYIVPINWLVIILLSLVFILGVVFELVF